MVSRITKKKKKGQPTVGIRTRRVMARIGMTKREQRQRALVGNTNNPRVMMVTRRNGMRKAKPRLFVCEVKPTIMGPQQPKMQKRREQGVAPVERVLAARMAVVLVRRNARVDGRKR